MSTISKKKTIVKYQSPNEYTLIKELGSGTFGEVWIAVDSDDSSVAIKFMNASRYEGYDDSVLNEIAYPLSLNHPNIVKYHAILGPEPIETIPQLEIEATSVIGVTMDTADGNLHSLIKNNKKLLDKNFEAIAFQLANAVAYITSHNIIHRDLKPENILYRGCPLTSQIKVTIIDFGAAISGECYYDSKASVVYTLPYRPPEVGLQQEFPAAYYTSKADVWALGCIFYEMYTGKLLFDPEQNKIDILLSTIFSSLGPPAKSSKSDFSDYYRLWSEKTTEKVVKKRNPLNSIKSANPDLYDLLKGMLKVDPKKRMSIFDVCNHRFFRTITTTIAPSPKIPCIRRSDIFDRDLSFNRFAESSKDTATTPSNTKLLFGWLLSVFRDIIVGPKSSYFSAIQLFCRFAVDEKITREVLQLYGVVALITAHESVCTMTCPSWPDYIYLAKGSITKEQIAKGQIKMMKTLNFDILANTPFHEIQGYSGQISRDIIGFAGDILAHLSMLPYYFEWVGDQYKYRRNLPVNCLALATIGMTRKLPVLYQPVDLAVMDNIVKLIESNIPPNNLIGIHLNVKNKIATIDWDRIIKRYTKFRKSYSKLNRGLIIGSTDELDYTLMKSFKSTSFEYYNVDLPDKTKDIKAGTYDIVIADCDVSCDDLVDVALKYVKSEGVIFDRSLVVLNTPKKLE